MGDLHYAPIYGYVKNYQFAIDEADTEVVTETTADAELTYEDGE